MATSHSSDNSSAALDSEYRSKFEQLLITLSTRFINLPFEAIDDGIVEALTEVGGYTGVDRCFVYQFGDASRESASLTHEWVAPGNPTNQHRLQQIPVPPLAWVVDQLAEGRIVHIPNRDELPPAADALRELHKSLGVRSAVYLPLLLKNEFMGTLGFSTKTHSRDWSDENINLLRIVGEIVINAIDRQRQYGKLQASREEYRSVVQNLNNSIVRWRPDGTQLFVNRAYCRLRQKSEQELLEENLLDDSFPQRKENIQRIIDALAPHKPHSVNEYLMRLPNGSEVWSEWSNRGLFDDQGQLTEILSIGRDVTNQKRAREELDYRQQLENLILTLTLRFINLPPHRLEHEIIDALRQVGEFVGGDRTYIYLVNNSTGIADLTFEWLAQGALPTPDELRQVSLVVNTWATVPLKRGEPLVVASLESLPSEADAIRRLLESIRTASFVMVPVLLNGQFFATLGISSTKHDRRWTRETMDLLRLIGEVFANAMERRSAEQALADNESRLRATIDAVADGFYDWNLPRRTVYLSDNWLRNRGMQEKPNLWTVDDWQNLIHSEDRPQVLETFNKHLHGDTATFECEYRVRMPDGSYRYRLNRGRLIERDAAGHPLRMVGVERDIHDQVQDRQRLAEADARLAHLSRVATMGEIVAGIAHEVNQPLHAAATFASAIQTALTSGQTESADRARDMARKISKQMDRAAVIIRRLRDFTRPQAVHMVRFDLNELIRESVVMPGLGSQRKNIRLKLDLDDQLPPVYGDRIQLQQVVVNLLRNAYQACEACDSELAGNSVVTILTRTKADKILMQVIDNGCGMIQDTEIEPLFDAFKTTKEDGMGMGLAISRSIVSGLRGKIWGEANPEQGMTFSVLLPAKLEGNIE